MYVYAFLSVHAHVGILQMTLPSGAELPTAVLLALLLTWARSPARWRGNFELHSMFVKHSFELLSNISADATGKMATLRRLGEWQRFLHLLNCESMRLSNLELRGLPAKDP